MKISKSIYGFSLLLLAMLMGCAGSTEYPPTDKAEFRVIQVPVIQGRLTTVGEIQVSADIAPTLSEIGLNISSDSALDQVRVMEKAGEELIEVFSGSGLSGKIRIPLDLMDNGEARTFLVQLQPSSDASLLERISLAVTHLTWADGSAVPSRVGPDAGLRLAKSLRNRGDDGVHSFRIPGLATSKQGTLLAVYDMRWERSNDLQGHVDVGLSRSTDGGKTWEPMKAIIDMGEWGGLPQDQNGVGDPAILIDELTGTIWVAALWMHGKPVEPAWLSSQPGIAPEQTGQFVLVKSEDDGVTWSEPINVTSSLKDPSWHLFLAGPGRGITLRDGTLVFAGQYKDGEQVPHATIIYSKDRGETWKIGKGARSSTTEAQVVELSDGSVMLNMRDDRGGSRSVMVTKDMGESWEEHSSHRSVLIDPICMASIIDNPYSERPMFFFSNPNTTDGRYNITLKASFDEGKSWPEQNQILLDEGTGWGYTCLTMIDADHIGILYESSQAHMTFQIIPVSELLANE